MAKKLTLPADWLELLRLLISRKVEFVISGGVAFSFHAKPRFTADIDIVLLPERENVVRFIEAFRAFGFQLKSAEPEQFLSKRKLIRVGVEPNMIDVMNFFDGATWEELFSGRVFGEVAGVSIPFVSLEHLIRNKRIVARPVDLGDLALLEKLR